MIINFFKTGTNVLLQCKVEEIRDNGETMRVRLLESNSMERIDTTRFPNEREGGLHKAGYIVHTLKENVFNVDLGIVERIAKKAGYSSSVTAEDVQEVVKSLAENYPQLLADETKRLYKKAVDQYTGDESTSYYWENLTNKLDSIFALLDIYTDYPGLYPTFELDRNNKHLCEYSTLGAIRQYNNFWGHW